MNLKYKIRDILLIIVIATILFLYANYKPNSNTKETKENQKDISFDKESCKKIASSLPTRKQVNFSTLKTKMKEKTENLNDKEKTHFIIMTSETEYFTKYENDYYIRRSDRRGSKIGIFYKIEKELNNIFYYF